MVIRFCRLCGTQLIESKRIPHVVFDSFTGKPQDSVWYSCPNDDHQYHVDDNHPVRIHDVLNFIEESKDENQTQ